MPIPRCTKPWEKPSTPSTAWRSTPNFMPRSCEFRDLGRMGYEEACALQRELVSARKACTIADQLLFVEHPHVVTLGRNAKLENVLAAPELLARSGIAIAET